MAEQLHRLPTGTWINLSNVTHIHVFNDQLNTKSGIGVTVFCGNNTQPVVPFITLTDAQNYADELAALVNEADAQRALVSKSARRRTAAPPR